ncbi:MAG: MBL fold metallo-hydrolase [Acidobacteria bacterium]|nr:MBL fold metallo-hydrolase [Acidobacteriota bacterium]
MRALTLLLTLVATAAAAHQDPARQPARTQVVLLGTGTPRPEPDRSGPATAIVVNDTAYLVDAGPGIVRRAAAAAANGIAALSMAKLDTLFITHLHSDHTVGLPDLIFTPWVQERRAPLRVFGPEGTQEMTRHILLAWQADVDIRTKGLERRGRLDVQAHDVAPGVVYKDANVTVSAFANRHGEWPHSFGYRFTTADRTVVISGDTSPSPEVVAACQKCDVLIHEVFSEKYQPADMPNWVEYRSKYHTTTSQLAEIANKAQPALLILHHRGAGSAEEYLADIRRSYAGKVVVGNDLDVY